MPYDEIDKSLWRRAYFRMVNGRIRTGPSKHRKNIQ
uniref:Uncharacterized protein n=1 Tax=Dulem virus 42 TaxID=3145760 RepID=A0AAU8B9X7_9CAUD